MGPATTTTTKIASSSAAQLLLVSGISFAAGITLTLFWDEVAAAARRKCRRRVERQKKNEEDDENDIYYLQRCHALRQSLSKPRHSQFRVVCLLLLDNDTILLGANDEVAVSVGGALCAERAAMLAYRTQYGGASTAPQIRCIYIVSDHPTMALPPGCLCREYLYGHVQAIPDPQQLRIVLQSSDTTLSPQIVTLQELYPFASVVARCRTVPECIAQCEERWQPQLATWWDQQGGGSGPSHHDDPTQLLDHNQMLSWTEIKQLVERAQQAAVEYKNDTDSSNPADLFAYGAAAAIAIHHDSDNHYDQRLHIVTAHQWTAQEYGCTQDAVCQLLSAIRQFVRDCTESRDTDNTHPTTTASTSETFTIRAMVQVDAVYGLPHAPFAPARSALVEFGFAQVPIVVAICDNPDDILRLQIVRAMELVPYAPKLPTTQVMN